MYYVYMLRCEDNSIYTGITTNIQRRMDEHLKRSNKCAKYTRTHFAKEMESIWKTENRVLASKLEYHIKKLNKQHKEEIIKDSNKLKQFLGEKIEDNLYKKIK